MHGASRARKGSLMNERKTQIQRPSAIPEKGSATMFSAEGHRSEHPFAPAFVATALSIGDHAAPGAEAPFGSALKYQQSRSWAPILLGSIVDT
jgi:hypothetical protein